MTEPKSVVLPLHHGPIVVFAGANVTYNFFIANFYFKKYEKPTFAVVLGITYIFYKTS